MITFRPLARTEVAQVWSIDRSEVIHNIYVLVDGKLMLKPDYFDAKGWPPGTPEQTTPALLNCFDRDGWCFGAFDDGKLVGVAILESKFIGEAKDQLQLKFLHVSSAYRKHGLGKQLFELARTEARTRGARQMYVSATPSENTIHFYQRRGCVLVAKPDPALFALEPEDIHLLCAI